MSLENFNAALRPKV
jgi:hypothetical protein